jgi:hypothetical protein
MAVLGCAFVSAVSEQEVWMQYPFTFDELF